MQNQSDTMPVRKTYMRRSLTMHNPVVIKSSDGNVYRRTGITKTLDYVRPKGRVYVAPPDTSAAGGSYETLQPFSPLFKKALAKKGFKPPVDINDQAKLFYNNIIAAKGFNGAKPVNFEAVDNADAATDGHIIDNILTYLRSLVSGVQPNGTALSTQDKELAPLAKDTVQQIAGQVANAGLSPQDAAKAGAQMSNASPVQKPFYKEPWFQTTSIIVVAFILVYMMFGKS